MSRAQAVANLARLYQTSPARIQRLLQQPRPVLKRVSHLAEAQKYQRVLLKYGIQCEIDTVAPPSPASPPATPKPTIPPQTHTKKPPARMRRWLQVLFIILLLGGGAWLAWQEYQQQRIAHYNDEVVLQVENAIAGFEQVLQGLLPYGKAEAVNLSNLQGSYTHTMQQLQQAYQHIEQLDIPPGEVCENFQQASLAFLKYQLDEGQRIKSILDYIAAHNPGSIQEILHLRQQLHHVGREEQKYTQALQQAQEQMAQHFQVALK